MARLVKDVDKYVADHTKERMGAYVVMLEENSEANQQKLAEFAKTNGVSIPLTIALEGSKGPSAYQINADIPITVLLSKRNKVEANVAFPADAPKEADAQKQEVAQVLATADKLIAK